MSETIGRNHPQQLTCSFSWQYNSLEVEGSLRYEYLGNILNESTFDALNITLSVISATLAPCNKVQSISVS